MLHGPARHYLGRSAAQQTPPLEHLPLLLLLPPPPMPLPATPPQPQKSRRGVGAPSQAAGPAAPAHLAAADEQANEVGQVKLDEEGAQAHGNMHGLGAENLQVAAHATAAALLPGLPSPRCAPRSPAACCRHALATAATCAGRAAAGGRPADPPQCGGPAGARAPPELLRKWEGAQRKRLVRFLCCVLSHNSAPAHAAGGQLAAGVQEACSKHRRRTCAQPAVGTPAVQRRRHRRDALTLQACAAAGVQLHLCDHLAVGAQLPHQLLQLGICGQKKKAFVCKRRGCAVSRLRCRGRPEQAQTAGWLSCDPPPD